MRILIAEDEAVTMELLQGLVAGLGHDVVMVSDGAHALACLESDDPPDLALLDWVMPVMNGPEVCSRLRQGADTTRGTYLILLTGRSRKADIVAGLRAGANDYVTKPFDPAELSARIDIGIRVSCLERKLRSRAREVKTLRDQLQSVERLLPVCASCRSRRTDAAFMASVEDYIAGMGIADDSCPSCVTVKSGV